MIAEIPDMCYTINRKKIVKRKREEIAMAEIKQNNFRIDQSDADTFRKFCDENGMSQAQGFAHLLQVFELDRAKNITPSRATEIEEFERNVKAITAAYLNSLEINNNAELRIREEYDTALASRDKTIMDLQKKNEQLNTDKDAAEQSAADASLTAVQATKEATDAKDRAEMTERLLEEKEKTITTLAAKVADAEEKLKEYVELKKAEQEAKEQIRELEQISAEQKKDHETALRELHAELERKVSDAKKDAELEAAKAVADKEREVRDIYEEKLRAADRENAILQAKIEQLQA